MSEYRIVKRSGSLDLSREVQTLVEQLCLESKSDLEVKYTRVLEAEKQAKDMLSVYKSAQKLKETYRMTTGMEKVWKELREREEKNGGKPLESGSRLSQEWVTQVVRIMKDYKSCFPKVGSSSLYLLEISERSCKDLSSLKRSVEELKKAGVVKEVYWDHKSYHETLEYLQLDPGRIESYLRGRKESSKKEFEESARVCLAELQRDGWERYQSKSCNNMKEKTLLEVLKEWYREKKVEHKSYWEIFSSLTEGGVNPLLEKLRLTGPEDVKCYVQSHKEVIPNVLGSYFAPRAKEEHKKVQEQTKVTSSVGMSKYEPKINRDPLNSEDMKVYRKFQNKIDPILNWVSSTFRSEVQLNDVMRSNLKQAFFMIGAMNPSKNYTDTRYKYKIGVRNYITIYVDSTLLSMLQSFDRDFGLSSVSSLTIPEVLRLVPKVRNEQATTQERFQVEKFFTDLADYILDGKTVSKELIEELEVSKEEVRKKKVSSRFYNFAKWTDTRNFDHIYKEGKSDFLGLDFELVDYSYTYKQEGVNTPRAAIEKIAKRLKNEGGFHIGKTIYEEGHLHCQLIL